MASKSTTQESEQEQLIGHGGVISGSVKSGEDTRGVGATGERESDSVSEADIVKQVTLDNSDITEAEKEGLRRHRSFLLLAAEEISGLAKALVLSDLALVDAALGDFDSSLEHAREANRIAPTHHGITRGYHLAARRAQRPEDIVLAIAGEAQCSNEADRDLLLLGRAKLLAAQEGEEVTSIEAYRQLTSGKQAFAANLGMEALALRMGDWSVASLGAKQAAQRASTPELRSALSSRSASHACQAQEFAAARNALEDALGTAPMSPLLAATIERLSSRTQDLPRLVGVREWQLKSGDREAFALQVDLGLLARYRLGNLELAQRTFEEIEEKTVGPARKLALAELAELYEQSGEWQALVDTLGKLVRLSADPERKAELLTRVADVSVIHLGAQQAAIAAYERAVQWVPNCRRALEGAGRLHRQRGDWEALIAMHRAELGLASDATERQEPAWRLGELLVRSEETLREGTELLLAVLPNARHHHAVFRTVEGALQTAERWADLVELYEHEAAGESGARQIELLEQAAAIADERLGDQAIAIELLRQIRIVEEPSLPRHLIKLSALLRVQQDWAGLATLLEKIEEDYPELVHRPSLLSELAEAREKSGQLEQASEAYRLACAEAPSDSAVLAAAGRFLLDQKKYEDLATLYQSLAEREASDTQAFWLTRAAEVLGDYLGQRDKAIDLLNRAVEAGSERALPTLRRILAVEGKWNELFLLGFDESAESRVRRGALAEAIGDPREAMQLYEEAHAMGETHIAVTLTRLRVEAGNWESIVDVGETTDLSSRLLAADVARHELGDVNLSNAIALELPVADMGLAMCLWKLDGAAEAARVEVLKTADSWGLDQVALAYFQYELAEALETQGGGDAALAWRMKLLREHGWNPLSSAFVEAELERQRRHEALVEPLRMESPGASSEWTAITSLRLGTLYSQLGMSVEAQRAWRGAVEADPNSASVSALVGLVASADRTGDRDAHRRALEEAARRIPMPWAQGLLQWVRGCSFLADGDRAHAREAYLAALEAEPAHRPSLGALATLLEQDDESGKLIEPLMRAFESSPEGNDLLDIGRCLATALINDGRLDNALKVAERLYSNASEDANVCMLLGEVYFRLGNHRGAAELSKEIAEREDMTKDVRSSAALRLAELSARELSEVEEAREWLLAVHPEPKTWVHAYDLVQIYQHCNAPEQAAEILEQLIEESTGPVRNHYLMQQAMTYESLSQFGKALESLGGIESAKDRQELVAHVFALVERTEETEIAIAALANSLEGASGLEPKLELDAHQWLVNVLLATNDRAVDAIPHLEKVASLVPQDLAVMEKLALLAAESDPARAIQYQAALLVKQPERVELFRSIRKLCVETDDIDGAFLVEAVMMGLGIANEDESYFYRQRRSQLKTASARSVEDGAISVLAPELDTRLVSVLGALEDTATSVLPVDWGGYGLDASALPGPGLLEDDFREVAQCLGVLDYKLVAVRMEITPVVELESQPIVLVPESIARSCKRHRQCIAAALFSRIRFRGVLGAPSSLFAPSPKQLEYLVHGVLSLVRETEVEGPTNAVYHDLYKRLDMAMSEKTRELLASEVEGYEVEENLGESIISAMNMASAKAALLFARDPAVAVECFTLYPKLIGAETEVEEGGDTLKRCLAFSVSAEHRNLRNTLQLGLDNG
ncbi:MAG: hypothetical protein GY811_23295 [Myxococcales bacterium]|nr:hypothetical protein [Myxococcales bacterium]